MWTDKTSLTPDQIQALMNVLQTRFEQFKNRHPGLDWATVQARLVAHPERLASLQAMEQTGGEPDVVGQDPVTGEIIFFDCAAESPAGRRSCCFDQAAWESRKANRPESNAEAMAQAMGVTILDEAAYRALQLMGEFDLKTSCWLATPEAIRSRGGALFGDRRYDTVFVYHNGAESYYAARGFRGSLRV